MRAVTTWLFCVVAAGPVLLACSAEPDDTPSLPAPPAPSTTVQPVPAESTSTGEEAETALMRTGERIAATYFEELEDLATGQPSSVDDLYSADCGFCAEQVRRIRDLISEGAVVEEHDTALDVRAETVTEDVVLVRVNGREAAGRLLGADGQVLQEFPPVQFVYVMNVLVSNGSGQVIDMRGL